MPGAPVNKIFCSNRCRQADWRKRQHSPRREKQTIQRELTAATCEHCQGGFLRATPRGRFCSTSCRSLYHRAMRASIPSALVEAYNIPLATANELIEAQPLSRVKATLTERGYSYNHQCREWVQALKGVQL